MNSKRLSPSFWEILILVLSGYFGTSEACSDVLVTPGASQDGSAMIAYNADDAALYGVLYHYPKTDNNAPDELLQIYDWDTGVSTKKRGAPTGSRTLGCRKL